MLNWTVYYYYFNTKESNKHNHKCRNKIIHNIRLQYQIECLMTLNMHIIIRYFCLLAIEKVLTIVAGKQT